MSNALSNTRKLDAITTPASGTAAAIQAAIDALGAAGGTVILSKSVASYDFGGVTIKPNVTIQGPFELVGSPATNSSAPYGSLGGAITIGSGATCTIKGGAGLSGCLIYRSGMTFPAANSSAFAGTALTAGGDDCFVRSSMILGFALAYTSSGYQRPRLHDVYFDCNSGLLIDNCADLSHIRNVHGWPFATIATLGGASTLQRSGTAFKFTTLADWCKLTDCFSYGYLTGFWSSGVNSMTYLGCAADGTTGYSGSKGFAITGGSTDTRLVACQAAAQETGVYVSTNAGLATSLLGVNVWGCDAHGVLIDAGDVTISGGVIRTLPNGVSVSSATSRVFANHIRFSAISGKPFNAGTATTLLFIGDECDYGDYGSAVASSSATPQVIASASAVTVPPSGKTFNVTGTTGIGTFNGGWNEREITLIFGAAGEVYSSTGTTAAARLNGGATFTTAAGSTLTLRHNGTQWYETGRSA